MLSLRTTVRAGPVSVFRKACLGDKLSILNYVHAGSALSIRSLARCGSALSPYGTTRVGVSGLVPGYLRGPKEEKDLVRGPCYDMYEVL